MELNVKALSPKIGTEIPAPFYATEGAAAMDLCACVDGEVTVAPRALVSIPTGIAIALPSADYVALVFARSGLGIKQGVCLSNGVGVIDSDYRGEILVGLQNSGDADYVIQPADRIAQLMVLPVVWGNVGRGIRETDPKLLEQAGALRFSRLKTVRLVYLPSVRPYFLSAVVTSLGLAWKSGVAAEVLCRPAWAVGTQIGQARDYLETPSLFAWTLVILLLSLTLEKLLSALLNRINRRWSP